MSSRAECNLAYYGIGIGIFNMQMRSVGWCQLEWSSHMGPHLWALHDTLHTGRRLLWDVPHPLKGAVECLSGNRIILWYTWEGCDIQYLCFTQCCHKSFMYFGTYKSQISIYPHLDKRHICFSHFCGAWYWGLNLGLSCKAGPLLLQSFCSGYFGDGFLWTICLDWL
jgi:hypothetical protein